MAVLVGLRGCEVAGLPAGRPSLSPSQVTTGCKGHLPSSPELRPWREVALSLVGLRGWAKVLPAGGDLRSQGPGGSWGQGPPSSRDSFSQAGRQLSQRPLSLELLRRA